MRQNGALTQRPSTTVPPRDRDARPRHCIEPLEPRRLLSVTLPDDINRFPDSNPLNPFGQINGKAVFSYDDGFHGSELYASDGTAAGTIMLRDINPGLGMNSDPRFLATVHGTLYFNADGGPFLGRQLWKTDGTPAGTVRLAPNATIIDPADFRPGPGNTTYFECDDPTNAAEFWKTDGTDAGTQRIVHIDKSSSRFLATWTAAGGNLFYFIKSTNPTATTEVWTYDGGPAGPRLLATIPLLNLGDVRALDEDTLAFTFNSGRELWTSDSTPAGTIRRSTNPNKVSFLDVVGRTLLFATTTATGTRPLQAYHAGGAPEIISTVSVLDGDAVLDDHCYFSDASRNFWVSDGTAAGTHAIPGSAQVPARSPPLPTCTPARATSFSRRSTP